jgi:hypothetical protein
MKTKSSPNLFERNSAFYDSWRGILKNQRRGTDDRSSVISKGLLDMDIFSFD